MTAQEALDGLRAASGIPWAYNFFEIETPYPFGVLIDDSAPTLFADNRAYFSVFRAQLQVYDATPNEDVENLVESWLQDNALTWRKEPRQNVDDADFPVPLFMTAYQMEAI